MLNQLKDLAESCRGSGGTIQLTTPQADVLKLTGDKTPAGGLMVSCEALVKAVDAEVAKTAAKVSAEETKPEGEPEGKKPGKK